MKTCPACGKEISEQAVFCPDCGAKQPVPEAPEESAAVSSAQAVLHEEPPAAPGFKAPERAPEQPEPFEQPQPQTPPEPSAPPEALSIYAPYAQGAQPQPQPEAPVYTDGKDPNRPLSTWAYALALFLMGLPLIGFVVQIVWAVGGTSSVNRRNLARGYLFLRVCIWVTCIVSAVVLLALLLPFLRRYGNDVFYYYNILRPYVR